MELCHQSSAMCVPTQAIIPVDEQQQKNQQTFHLPTTGRNKLLKKLR